MKKVLVILMLSFIASVYGVENKVEIESISGFVKYKTADNELIKLSKDAPLTLDTYISTGIKSELVVVLSDGSTVTIGAVKRGQIKKFLGSSKLAKKGLKVGNKLTKSKVDSDTVQERTNISTASTRAEEYSEDEELLEWVEEE